MRDGDDGDGDGDGVEGLLPRDAGSNLTVGRYRNDPQSTRSQRQRRQIKTEVTKNNEKVRPRPLNANYLVLNVKKLIFYKELQHAFTSTYNSTKKSTMSLHDHFGILYSIHVGERYYLTFFR